MFKNAVIILITILFANYSTNIIFNNLLIVVFITSLLLIRYKFIPSYLVVLCAAIIFGNYKFKYEHEKWILSKFYYSQVAVTGQIISISNNYFIIKIDNISNNNQHVSYKFNKIYLKANCNNQVQNYIVAIDDIIKFNTTLKPSINLNNFISDESIFNSNYYYGISTKTANLQSVELIKKNDAESLRLKILNNLNVFLENKNNSSIIKALLLGDKSALSRQERELFQNTGTSHLIVVSGMHVAFIFHLMLFIGSKLWVRYFYVKFFINKITFCFTIAWISSLFYCFISGFGIPAIRALISISVLYLLKLFRIKINVFDIFSLSLILVLIFNPLVIYSMGFWLSFIATFYLICLYVNIFEFCTEDKRNNNLYVEKIKTISKSTIYSSSSMFLLLLPLNIYYFSKIAIFSVIANIIAIPVNSFFVLPFLFIALLLILFNFSNTLNIFIDFIISTSDYILDVLLNYLYSISRLDINMMYYYCDFISLLILTLFIIFLILPKGIPKLNLLCMLALIFLLNLHYKHINEENSLLIDVLDVGQGLAVLVNTKNHQLLYDTAGGNTGGFAVQKTLLNTIISNKNKLDAIIISHWDIDHSGNLPDILNYAIPNVLYSSNFDKFSKIKESKKITHSNCNNNYSWYWDNIKFSFFKVYNDQVYRGNNSSCILKIQNDKTSILLTGDIENKTEQILVQEHNNNLRSDILLVPHHGSKTSSSDEFIKQVSPKYALISVGLDNIYRLPNNSIINKYQSNNIKLYRTDLHGAIKINIRDNKIAIKTKLNN